MAPAACYAAIDMKESYVGRTILVGSELDYPPYATVDANGDADGFSVDLIKAVAKQVGMKVKFEVGPWEEVKGKLERGEIDALPLVAYSTERDKQFDFSDPHIISHAVAFVRKNQTRFSTIADLRGKAVIVMRSDSTHEYVLFSQITDNITLTDTVGDAFKLLASGKHDFVIAPKLSGLLLLDALGLDNIEAFGEPLETYGKGYSFAVSEGNKQLLDLLNRGLVLVRASGEYNRIYDKWFAHIAPREENAAVIRKLLIAAGVALLIIVVIALWNLMLRRQVKAQTLALEDAIGSYQDLYDNAPDMYVSVSAETAEILQCNQTLVDKLGYSKAELIGKPVFFVYHQDCLAQVHEAFETFIHAGEVVNKELILKCNDGSKIDVMLNVSAVTDEDGKITHSRSSWRDVSELKQVEHELEQFFELVPDMVCVANPDGYFTNVNEAWSRVLGYSKDELCRKPFIAFIHPDDRDLTDETASVSRKQTVMEFVNRYRCKDGSYKWLEWVSAPGQDGMIYAVARDVTERRELNQQIVLERNLAHKYLDVAAVMMLALDTGGNVTLINREGLKILGFEEEELLHKNWFDTCIPTAVKDEVKAVFNQLMLGELELVRYYENPVVTRTGEERIIAFHNSLLMDDQGNITGLISSGEDITERKLASEKLLKLSQAVEQAGEAVVITDAKGRIEYINKAFSRITGYSREEAIGENPSMLKSGEHDQVFYEAMWGRLSSGKVWQGRVIDKRKDGKLYPVMVTISPLKNEEGVTTHYVGVQQSLKKYEDLEKQFYQSQKMEAIGTLVGGIAHDFNNSLAGIISNLYLARRHSTDPDVIKRVENAEKLSFSAAAIIQQLLTFSRKGPVSMGLIPIASFIKEAVKLNRVSVPESIVINLDLHEDGLKVKGDVNQLQQVIMNLINNARDAVEHSDNPEINISMHAGVADADEQAAFPKLRNQTMICITVEDNGCGIKPVNREHIFEPFFTTKEQGKGTGLGLAMVYGAVKTHHGWIFAKPGKGGVGTLMKIYLPDVKDGVDHAAQQDDDVIVAGKGETILLVDDNEILLEVGKEVLEGLNYQVLTAIDGLDAIGVYTEHRSEIDMLLLDVVMPRLGGMEALKQIRQMNPDVKALFATGYNKASALALNREFQSERIISKPFAISELSQEIRKKLEG